MGVGFFHKSGSVVALSSAIAALSLPSKSWAQTLSGPGLVQNLMLQAAPLAIAAGAIGFGIVAAVWVLKARRHGTSQEQQSQHQIARMRATLDEYEALLAGSGEVTILWSAGAKPIMFGKPEAVCVDAGSISALLRFSAWISPPDAKRLEDFLAQLRASGRSFQTSLITQDGRLLRALGRTIGGATSLRLRVAGQNPQDLQSTSLSAPDPATGGADRTRKDPEPDTSEVTKNVEAVLAMLTQPAWVRDQNNVLVFVNQAYTELSAELDLPAGDNGLPELFPASRIAQHRSQLERSGGRLIVECRSEALPDYRVSLSRIVGGSVGCLIAGPDNTARAPNGAMVHAGGIIGTLTTPVVVFDAEARLTQFNSAYAGLWRLDENWLRPGLNEGAIIDRLHRQDLLPAKPDYQAWRNEHLQHYANPRPREECWHLPDGRTINVIAAPAASEGGIIYVFEDVSDRLKLESANKALIHVQRETLNALSEGVGVFSTDGRLRLHNPRLSAIWKLPMNELGLKPHINQIAEACGRNLSADGQEIWLKLKQSIVDLNPSRSDKSGRFSRSDGCLIDYAIVRLPDSQTMLTFVDVTQSANYEQVLKERNDALVTADRLKDAFVRNVSYELRSPLTNIIGFADLLSSHSIGELNAQQRAYTGYIRASSTTLGVLIDNILDLAHVDAGIAELDLEELDVGQLIDKAKTGLAVNLTGADGEQPLNLKVHLPEQMPKFVADGARIVQIFYNLLSNAARFSDRGARVDLRVEVRGDWIRFIVEDSGVGVSEQMQAALLQRFEGKSVDGLQRGAGLGLTIVNAFVELHGGNLNMQARKPNGTRVIVNLPLDASPYVAAPAVVPVESKDGQ